MKKRTLEEKFNMSEKEIEHLLKSIQNKPPEQRISFEDYFESKTRIGVISDTHIGQMQFDEPLFKYMGQIFKKQKVSRVYHVGDHLEGMSGRPGQIYELTEIGFTNQINKAEELYGTYLKGMNIFGINGNHDLWYLKKNNGGVNVSQELDNRLKNYHHLGDSEADIKLRKNVTMKLFHPNDGSAYAYSYKMQKLVESLIGEKKPNILIEGHYHKALYMFLRNVHCLEAATLCGQTSWMRGKKIAAHKGFWVIDIEMGKGGIGKVQPTLYPGYK